MIKRAYNLPIINNDADLLAAYILENGLLKQRCTDIELVNLASDLLIDPRAINNEAFYLRLFSLLDPYLKIRIT